MPRILIVDDACELSELLEGAATALGFEPKVISARFQFERVLADWHPMAVILHVLVPEQDGLDFLVSLSRQRFKGRLILIGNSKLMSFGMLATSARARGLLVSASIGKPITVEEIQHALRQGLGPASMTTH